MMHNKSMARTTMFHLIIVAAILFCPLLSPVVGILPPNKEEVENGTYESLIDYRRRLGIDFSYDTKHINPEYCRTLTEEECRRLDEREGELARKHRLFLNSKGRKELYRRSLQSQHPFRSGVSTVSGTLNVLVCLLVWSDHEGQRDLPPREDFNQIFNADDFSEELYPSGSIKRYFETMSYGDFSIDATVVEWAVTDNTEAFYSQPNRGRTAALLPAFAPVLDALSAEGFNFAPFDQDGDGNLDLTVFLHSGYDGLQGGTDAFGASADQRIAAHAFTGAEQSFWQSPTGFRLGPYAVASAFIGLQNFNSARIGVITHEMLHTWGLPDVYDVGTATLGAANLGGIANYDIMANPRGQSDRLAWPGHVSAWTRWFLGWVDPIEITQDGTYEARAVEQNPDIYRISQGYAEKEFLLIENRQPIPLDFDERFYEPGGILIYHIDENNLEVDGYGNSPAGGPFQADWPQNGLHYPVALLQRDGLYELEQLINNGHIDDVYQVGSEGLFPGDGTNFPNTDSYAFGVVQSTGIAIENFVAVPGSDPTTIRFDVSGLRQVETPSPSGIPTEPPTMAPTIQPTDETDSPTEPLSTEAPSSAPSSNPTDIASEFPSFSPSEEGATRVPTTSPSTIPSSAVESEIPTMTSDFPTISAVPTLLNITASDMPSSLPSSAPSKDGPVGRPTLPFQIDRSGLSARAPNPPIIPPKPTFPPRPKPSPVGMPRKPPPPLEKSSKKSKKSSKKMPSKGGKGESFPEFIPPKYSKSSKKEHSGKGKGGKRKRRDHGKGKGDYQTPSLTQERKRFRRFSTDGLQKILGLWTRRRNRE